MISFRNSLQKKLLGENNRFYCVTMVNKSKSFRWDGHVSGVAIQRVKKFVL